MEIVSFAVMVMIAAIGATFLVIKNNRKTNVTKITENIFIWMFYFICQLLLMNVGRCAILIPDELIDYREDLFILAYDLGLTVIGCLFFPYLYNRITLIIENKAYPMIYTIVFIVTGIVYALYKYLVYKNYKSAIFDMFLPISIVIVCLAAIVISYLVMKILYIAKEGRISKVQSVQHDKVYKSFVLLCFLMTVVIYPAYETYLTNIDEFSFGIREIWFYEIILVMISYIAIYFFCKILGKNEDIFITMLFALSVSSYLQEMFMNGKLFLMDGNKGQWSTGLKIFNFLIWVSIFAVVFLIYKKRKEKFKEVCKFVSAILFLMQLVGGISLIFSTDITNNIVRTADDYFGSDGLYEVAEGKNVLVFVLDTYDIDYLNEVLEQEPDFLKTLNGFTYFPDTVSQYSRTFPSIPYMLTDEKYFYDVPYVEYCNSSFQKCKFWEQLINKDYKLYFYLESSEYVGVDIRERASNYVKKGYPIGEETDFAGFIKAVYEINNFRIMPYILKDYYRYTAESINNLIVTNMVWSQTKFESDDAEIYNGVINHGLSVTKEENKAFKFYHLTGAHAPYTMNEDGKRVNANKNTKVAQYIGSMKIVYNYISELKKLGLFDDSTIVITADHGENYVTKELEQNTNPILFIKPAGVSDDEELKVSDVYASQNDILPTLASQVGIEVNKLWGINLFDTKGHDKERKRYHYYTVVENGEQTKLRTYVIDGSSLDFQNWYATDEYKEFRYY